LKYLQIKNTPRIESNAFSCIESLKRLKIDKLKKDTKFADIKEAISNAVSLKELSLDYFGSYSDAKLEKDLYLNLKQLKTLFIHHKREFESNLFENCNQLQSLDFTLGCINSTQCFILV